MHQAIQKLLDTSTIIYAKYLALHAVESAKEELEEPRPNTPDGLEEFEELIGFKVDLDAAWETRQSNLRKRVAGAVDIQAELETIANDLPAQVEAAALAAPKAKLVIDRLHKIMAEILANGDQMTLQQQEDITDAERDLKYAVKPIKSHLLLDDEDFDIDDFDEEDVDDSDLEEDYESDEDDSLSLEEKIAVTLRIMANPQSANPEVDCTEALRDFLDYFKEDDAEQLAEDEDLIPPSSLSSSQQKAMLDVWKSWLKLTESNPEVYRYSTDKCYRDESIWESVKSSSREALSVFEEELEQ